MKYLADAQIITDADVQRHKKHLMDSIALNTAEAPHVIRICERLNELAMEDEHGYFGDRGVNEHHKP